MTEPAETHRYAELEQHRVAGAWFALHDLAAALSQVEADDLRLLHYRGLALANLAATEEGLTLLISEWARVEKQSIAPELLADLWGLRARLYKDRWRRDQSFETLMSAYDAYAEGFSLTGEAYPAINAASMAALAGLSYQEHAHAALRRASRDNTPANYWTLATIGEAQMLLGGEAEAIEAFQSARYVATPEQRTSTKRQLVMLAEHGVEVHPDILSTYSQGPVLVFTGHMIDSARGKRVRFPADLEGRVKAAISAKLHQLDPISCFCSGAAGADILFLEAMLEQGRPINLVLPFAFEDFIETSVAFAGPRWTNRLERLLDRATAVEYITKERFNADTGLFAACNTMIFGKAVLKAKQSLTDVQALAVIDGTSEETDAAGGSMSFVNELQATSDVHVIDLAELRGNQGRTRNTPSSNNVSTETNPTPARKLVAMMAADFEGYSRLSDAEYGAFSKFMRTIADNLETQGTRPEWIRTVGDAILAISPSPRLSLDYAFAVRRAVAVANNAVSEMPFPLRIRIALHAAPIYPFYDPIIKAWDWYGAHLVRTVRLEAVTVPNQIFATNEFVAWLAAKSHHGALKGDEISQGVNAEYVGVLELAKQYGTQPVFNLVNFRPVSDATGSEAMWAGDDSCLGL